MPIRRGDDRHLDYIEQVAQERRHLRVERRFACCERSIKVKDNQFFNCALPVRPCDICFPSQALLALGGNINCFVTWRVKLSASKQFDAISIRIGSMGPKPGLHSERKWRLPPPSRQLLSRSANRGACVSNKVLDRVLPCRCCFLRDCACFLSSLLHSRGATDLRQKLPSG
jgi:hypothetical protein